MRKERGSSLIELSLSILIFLVLLLGIMDFGRIVAAYNILAGATKEGARFAMVHGSMSGSPASNSDVQAVVQQWAIGLTPANLTVSTTWTPSNAPGNPVLVTATYTITPLLIWISGNSLSLTSRSQMHISQ